MRAIVLADALKRDHAVNQSMKEVTVWEGTSPDTVVTGPKCLHESETRIGGLNTTLILQTLNFLAQYLPTCMWNPDNLTGRDRILFFYAPVLPEAPAPWKVRIMINLHIFC